MQPVVKSSYAALAQCHCQGLFRALSLHRNGVDVILIERQKALYPLPRAVAFDHESRRLVGFVGLSRELAVFSETIVSRGGDKTVRTSAGETAISNVSVYFLLDQVPSS